MDLHLAIEPTDILTVFLRDGEAQATVSVHSPAAGATSLGRALRTAMGVYELLTFPIPANDYEPVVLPVYPFEPGPPEAFPDTP